MHLVADIVDGEMELVLFSRKRSEEYCLVCAVSLSELPFDPIAVHCVLEASLGRIDEATGGDAVPLLRGAEHDPQRITDESLPGGIQFVHGGLSIKMFRFGKSVPIFHSNK